MDISYVSIPWENSGKGCQYKGGGGQKGGFCRMDELARLTFGLLHLGYSNNYNKLFCTV